MTHHRLEPRADTVCDVLTCDRAAVLEVEAGDAVTVRTLDCWGNLERTPSPRDGRHLIADSRGHCLVGPIVVTGARPGQVLAIGLDELTPDTWGLTAAGGRDNELNRRLGTADADPVHLLWNIDGAVATDQHGISVAVRPFLGVVGLPPTPTGEHSTIPPRADGAGNIDCRELVAGSTLFVPVTVPGAYLFVGDGHAAQGDGEVGGTAIETGMTTTLTLDLLDGVPVGGVHAVTPAGLITFGFDYDLNAATGDALAAMLDWMQYLSGMPRATVLAIASTGVDVRVTQVANGTWGVHGVLPTALVEHLTRWDAGTTGTTPMYDGRPT